MVERAENTVQGWTNGKASRKGAIMFKHAAQYRMLLSNYFTFSDISHHINLECMSSTTQVQGCEVDKGKDNKSIH